VKRKTAELHLTEPYQRAISSSLAIVEERLFELERLLKNEHGVSIFNSVRSTLGPEQKQHIQREIEDIREGLWDIKSTLSLKSSSVNDAVLIGSRCASIWEMLCNLETKTPPPIWCPSGRAWQLFRYQNQGAYQAYRAHQ